MVSTENTKIFAEILEDEALEQFYKAMALPCNIQGALMPDTHTGYTLPIGAVIKSIGKVFPSYVGYDIGCGMCSVKTDISVKDLDLKQIKENILKKIPIGANKHSSKQRITNRLPNRTQLGESILQSTGIYQIGTLGSGNHFIELGTGEDDLLSITIHSGSRGLGKKIAEYYMKQAAIEDVDKSRYEEEFERNNDWEDKNPMGFQQAKEAFVYRRTRARLSTNIEGHYGFDISSPIGKDYLLDLEFALEFALENRKTMIEKIIQVIEKSTKSKVNITRFINRNHNHAEVLDNYVIHRKGATHAEEGMLGVIPGNMKDGCFIVVGKGSQDSICSSSHGAGRVLSRSQAKNCLDFEAFQDSMKGIETNHTINTLDEAPLAYKNIFEVMEQQKDLVDIIEHIKPILNIKG